MGYSNEIKPTCRLSEIKDRSAVNGNLLVVRDAQNKAEALVYADNETNTVDRVRSAFAKATGVKRDDTRCSRLKNVK
jgi:hypothetical protein